MDIIQIFSSNEKIDISKEISEISKEEFDKYDDWIANELKKAVKEFKNGTNLYNLNQTFKNYKDTEFVEDNTKFTKEAKEAISEILEIYPNYEKQILLQILNFEFNFYSMPKNVYHTDIYQKVFFELPYRFFLYIDEEKKLFYILRIYKIFPNIQKTV